MTVIKYYNVIPRNPSKKWATRTLHKITKIVIHQLASPSYTGTKDIDNNIRYFLSPQNHITPGKPLPYIPYHVIIDEDGKAYQLNHLTDITWHCKGYNTSSIGIALMGSFDGPTFKGRDGNPTKLQINTLIKILNGLQSYPFNDVSKEDVYGHCELDPVNKENCPGNGAMHALKEWRKL